jgi:hypothetical protein
VRRCLHLIAATPRGCSRPAGGEFYDLAGPKTDLAFCPRKGIDQDSDVQRAVGWVEVLCELNGLKFSPKHRNAVAEAVLRLQLSPTTTLTELSAERAEYVCGHGWGNTAHVAVQVDEMCKPVREKAPADWSGTT